MKKRKNVKVLAGLVSAVAVLMICITGAYAYYAPTGYITLDVNPSIEYTVNMFDRVIDVVAVNEDGEAILEELDVKNSSIQDAIEETTKELIEQGYISEEDGAAIVISTSGNNEEDANDLADDLYEKVTEFLEDNNLDVEVEAFAVGRERVKRARDLGVTPGKLNIVERMQASLENPEDFDMEEWLNKPVREINKAMKEIKRDIPKNADSNAETSIERAEQNKEKAEQNKEKAEQNKEKAEQNKEKVEQNKERAEQNKERAEQNKERAEQNKERAEQNKERASEKAQERVTERVNTPANNQAKNNQNGRGNRD